MSDNVQLEKINKIIANLLFALFIGDSLSIKLSEKLPKIKIDSTDKYFAIKKIE
jgi:hypothetical protein